MIIQLPRRQRLQDSRETTVGQLLQQTADLDTDVPEQVIANVEAAPVRRFVGTLPPLERRVVASLDGLGGEEVPPEHIVQRLGVSRGAVDAIHEQALERLRALFDPEVSAA